MKTIGLIGGVSWVSTSEYYRRLNLAVNGVLGGVSSAKILLESVNFQEILPSQLADRHEQETQILSTSARNLERAGADVIGICSCTTSMLAAAVERRVRIPLLNIVESISRHVARRGYSRVGLLGTQRVMYKDYFKAALAKQGVFTVVPEPRDGEEINRIIYEELVNNIFLPRSQAYLDDCIRRLTDQNAEAVILGCTELPLLATQKTDGPEVIDSIQVHVDDIHQYLFHDQEACCG
jgi:aspartate racemase